MAAPDTAGRIQALILRVARLAADGTTPAGQTNMYVTDALIKVDYTPEYDTGTEVVKKNGGGGLCIAYKIPDTLKRYNVSLEICSPDPELEELLAGGRIFQTTGATPITVGGAPGAVGVDAVPNGVSIEAFSRAVVGNRVATTYPFFWDVLPRVYLKRDVRNIDENGGPISFSGFATENPLWGNGPQNDWLYPSDRCVQTQRISSIPTTALGYQATPVQT